MDLSDVGGGLQAFITGLLYPATRPAEIEFEAKVYQGWPVPDQLKDDLAAKIAHVSIFSTDSGQLHALNETFDGAAVNHLGTRLTQVRRDWRTYLITIWAWHWDARDALAKFIDANLSQNQRIAVGDEVFNLQYIRSPQGDTEQRQGIYRRDLMYRADYPVTVSEVCTEVLHTVLKVSGGPSLSVQGPLLTITAP